MSAHATKFVIGLLMLLWVSLCWSTEFDQPARALQQKIIGNADYITQQGKNLKMKNGAPPAGFGLKAMTWS